jgi:hypothetical protein
MIWRYLDERNVPKEALLQAFPVGRIGRPDESPPPCTCARTRPVSGPARPPSSTAAHSAVGQLQSKGADRIRTGESVRTPKKKVYRRKRNPVTVTYADGTVEVVDDWHNSTPERRKAEDKRKRLRKQKWIANQKRKRRERGSGPTEHFEAKPKHSKQNGRVFT